MRRLLPLSVAAVLAAASAVVLPAGATAAPVAPAGSTGGGDPYFPAAGNGGYDVQHYDLDITYDPATRDFAGVATITGVATARVSSMSLDLRGLTASAVTVDGRALPFSQVGDELVVQALPVPRVGQKITAVVTYGGTTTQPLDSGGAYYGWVSTDDGAFVANEPEGASTWFPVDDVPTDKATYSFEVTVPEGKTAVANGDLVSQVTEGGWTTWTWDAPEEMASYLAMAAIGDYDLTTSVSPGGVRLVNAVDRDLSPAAKARAAQVLAEQPDQVDTLSDFLGGYPFSSFGAVFDDDTLAGYALENQTRPIYSGVPGPSTTLHELAHQWFGDAVSPERWSDIWLNEGWATYSEWYWDEQHGGPAAQETFEAAYADPDSDWTTVVDDPGADNLFADATYTRGAMTLQALRVRIGDEAMTRLTRRWWQENAGSTASTADFRALAEEVSGQDLDAFFDTWLSTSGRPTTW